MNDKIAKLQNCKIARINKKGFTLAEVLITLAVIGVVAALAIPALQSNTNDAELRTKWKKLYSTMSNATNLMINDNGGSLLGVFSDANSIVDEYAKYLSLTKSCKGDVSGNCWHDTTDPVVGYNSLTFSSSWNTFLSTNTHGMILNDGSFLIFHGIATHYPVCSMTSAGSDIDNICVYFVADVNGFKGPNKMGKDQFIFFVHKDRIKPFSNSSNAAHLCNKNQGGYNCAGRWLYSDEEE